MGTADQLITKVNIPDFYPKIRYSDPVFMNGSCFTEHISDKLDRYKYEVLSNPFGILYNPVSLATSFDRIVRLDYYQADELVMHDGLYHSLDHHGSYSGKNRDEVLDKINRAIFDANNHLQKSVVVCISPGTSSAYHHHARNVMVGNCHKIPQSSFIPIQLSLEQCVEAFEKIYKSILHLSPGASIIWTVSPVRYLRDGLVANQRSKATLLLGIQQIMATHTDTNYFPAYEIMMDELRDYRYYARDLIHPSPVAVDILWEIFCAAYLDPGEHQYHPQIEKIKRAMEHRLLHNDPEAIRAFAQGQLKNIDSLTTLLPELNWKKERQYFFEMLELD